MAKNKKFRVTLTESEIELLGRRVVSSGRYILSQEEFDLIGGKNRKKLKAKNKSKKSGKKKKDNETVWDESSDGALWSYEGYSSIRTLEQALAFCQVDLEKWEVERHIFNAWDVTMSGDDGQPITATNYQVKVWFRPTKKIKIERPVYRNIKVRNKDESQMWVTIGCVHRPFHDKILWDKFLNFLEYNRKKITGVLINGDWLDLRSLSSHEEWIPEGVDLQMEYSDGLQGIEDIEQRLHPLISKIFHYGNHEERFFRDKKSIRKYGSTLQSPHEAMELEQRGWDVMTDWKNGFTTLGNDLDVFHGTKVGMNAAKDQLQAIPDRNHIFNHTHRFGTYSNSTHSAYNLGCMIDMEHEMFNYVDRGVRNAWAHGFGVIYIDKTGNSHVTPIKVAKDRSFFFEGVSF